MIKKIEDLASGFSPDSETLAITGIRKMEFIEVVWQSIQFIKKRYCCRTLKVVSSSYHSKISLSFNLIIIFSLQSAKKLLKLLPNYCRSTTKEKFPSYHF